jgi:hypothetical protein
MDISAWEQELQEPGLNKEYKDVIHGFKSGSDQGISPHSLADGQNFFTTDNHQSATKARERIEANLREEILAGRMFGLYTHNQVAAHFPFFRSNPLGAFVNGDGSLHPTNDLLFPHGDPDTPSVNSFVNKLDYATTWDNFNVASSFIRSH